jgi:hypothetical protein
MSYIAEIETRVAGIPCIIGVTHFESVRGSFSYHAASDWDFHGYVDCEFEVCDRRGRLLFFLKDDPEKAAASLFCPKMPRSLSID